jgi:hypothetical protein
MAVMVGRDLIGDIVAILEPMPATLDPAVEMEASEVEAHRAGREQAVREREELEASLRLSWEEGDIDPLLSMIAAARARMLAAERDLRLLVAYGREFVHPRPYRLEDLAGAAGMSISGVRTAYDDEEVEQVAEMTARRPRPVPTRQIR